MENFISKIIKIREGRMFYFLLAFLSLFLIFIAHFFFQNFLFMQPCKLCIAIRYSFLIIAIFAGILAIQPKNIYLQIFGTLGMLSGIFRGSYLSIKLMQAYEEVKISKEVQACSAQTFSPLQNYLGNIAPTWLKATGECGNDLPNIPVDAKIGLIQKFFLDLYSEGWYLLPKYHFINMAQACLIIFILFFLVISFLFLLNFFKKS